MSKNRSILKKPAPLKAVHLDIPEEDDKTSGETAQSEESNELNEGANKSEAENPTPPPPTATSEGKKEGPSRKFKNKNLRAVDSIRVASDRLSSSPRSKFLKKRKQNETNSPRLTPRMGHVYEGEACFTFPDTQEAGSAVPVTSAFRKRSSPRPAEETHISADKVPEPTKSFDKNEDPEQTKTSEKNMDPKPTKTSEKTKDPKPTKPSDNTKETKPTKLSDKVEYPETRKPFYKNEDSEPTQPPDETDSVTKAVPSPDSSENQHQTTTNTPGAVAKSPAASVDVADDILTDELIPSRETHDSVDIDTVVCGSTSEESAVDSSNILEEASLDHFEVLSPPVPMEDNGIVDAYEVVSENPDKDEDQRQMVSDEGSRASESTDINMESIENKLTSAANETINSLKRLSATGSDMDYDDEDSLV